MNNEILLYNLIKDNGGQLAARDSEVSKAIGRSISSIAGYKRKLIRSGYIETKVKVINNRRMVLYRILKEYNGEIEW